MKTLFCLLFLFANSVSACIVTITPPIDGGTVAGYNLYINDELPIDVGNVTTWDCTGRTGIIYAKAYNVLGESIPSNTINFMRPPGAPGLSIQY